MQETSLSAYEAIKPELKLKRKKVLDAIKSTGTTGATLFELVKMIGRPVNEISGRVTELHRAFMIEENGKRENPDTGRKAIVWKAKQNE